MRVNDNILSSPEKKKRKRNKLLIKTGLVVGAVLLVFGLGVYGLHSERVRIADIIVEGIRVVPEQEIIDIVRKELEGSYLVIFPKSAIFLYPKEKIVKNIIEGFGRVSDVDVSMANLTSITVTVTEREPTALWCGETVVEEERSMSTPCYFVDETGLVFARAPHFSSNVYFEYYSVLQPGIGVSAINPIDGRFLNEEDFTKSISFMGELKSLGLEVYRLFAGDTGMYEFFLTEGDGKIILNAGDDYGRLLFNLEAALETKRAEREGGNVTTDLEYIDLRFDNKVLFKFKK